MSILRRIIPSYAKKKKKKRLILKQNHNPTGICTLTNWSSNQVQLKAVIHIWYFS